MARLVNRRERLLDRQLRFARLYDSLIGFLAGVVLVLLLVSH